MEELRPYFAVLDLPPNSSAEEVKAAYVDLVKIWHPDRYQNEPERLRLRATEKLRLINDAYARLRGRAASRPSDSSASTYRSDSYAPNYEADEPIALTPMRFGEEWGYVDAQGRLIIKPRFALAFGFHQGYARVAIPHAVYRLLYGFIDPGGEFVIHPQFVQAGDFSEGLAAAVFSHKWGFIDFQASFRIHPTFEAAGEFNSGVAPVRQRGQWGYVGTQGEYLIAPRYDEARNFHHDVGFVRLADRWGKVNKQGEVFFLPAGELPPTHS
jgi:hypothetical protein